MKWYRWATQINVPTHPCYACFFIGTARPAYAGKTGAAPKWSQSYYLEEPAHEPVSDSATEEVYWGSGDNSKLELQLPQRSLNSVCGVRKRKLHSSHGRELPRPDKTLSVPEVSERRSLGKKAKTRLRLYVKKKT